MAQQQGDGVAKMQEALAEPVKQGTKKKPNATKAMKKTQPKTPLAVHRAELKALRQQWKEQQQRESAEADRIHSRLCKDMKIKEHPAGSCPMDQQCYACWDYWCISGM